MEFSLPFVQYLSSTSLSYILNLYFKLHANSKDKYKKRNLQSAFFMHCIIKTKVYNSEWTLVPKLDP